MAESLTSEHIDKLILEQGLTLNNDALELLTVDEETKKTITEIEQILNDLLDSNTSTIATTQSLDKV